MNKKDIWQKMKKKKKKNNKKQNKWLNVIKKKNKR